MFKLCVTYIFGLVAQLRDSISQKDEEIAKIRQSMEHQDKELDLINEELVIFFIPPAFMPTGI